MNWLLYWFGRVLVALVQAFPLSWVARFGRACGAAAYGLDARHRRVALRNLTMCFGGEKEPEEIEAIARENFRRIGENFACAIRIAAMRDTEFKTVMTVIGTDKLTVGNSEIKLRTVVVAIGHFGNFELYAHTCRFMPHYRFATTYRGLRQPAFNRLMQELRLKSGCLFFERRVDMAALKATMHQPGLLLGLLADQHAGDRGARLPFLGHDCSTSVAPAVFALRYNAPLIPAICRRVAPCRWEIEIGDEIPTHENGRPRSTEAISADMNRAFEAAVRRDPANWFWVHNRWKPGKWRGGAANAMNALEQGAVASMLEERE